MISARAPLDFALPMLSRIKSSTAGLMEPSITIRSTCGAEESFGCARTDSPTAISDRKKKILSIFTLHRFHHFFYVFPHQFLVRRIAQQVCRVEGWHQLDAHISMPSTAQPGDWNF